MCRSSFVWSPFSRTWMSSALLLLLWRVASGVQYRLPDTTRPHRYDISLDVNPNPAEFYLGNITIHCSASSSTSEVVLHADNINLTHVWLYNRRNDDIYQSHHQSDDDTHFLVISLTEQLEEGDPFVIQMSFQGRYHDYQSGIFRDSYRDKDNTTRYLVGTQMEATYARSAFPCYDEPQYKAIFYINITCPSTHHTLSNAPILDTRKQGNNKTVYSFKATPPMPSYLVAFVVSEFDHVSNSDEDVEQFIFPKEFKCHVQPDEKKALNFSLDFGQRTLSVLEEYTSVEYAMEKMDNVGIPSFGGAMENWGLVIYGEYALAERKNKKGDVVNLQTIGEIMSHEFAHMWFGNEVTPLWWDFVWLSEGFATHFQHSATSEVKPTWNSTTKFVTRSLQYSLYLDGYSFARSMNSRALTPREISRKFNYVSYSKAGSVIRMMQHFLGEDVFQDGLRRYLKSLPKGSTVPFFLYDAMQNATENKKDGGGLPEKTKVSDVMSTWADQAGFPLITINRTEAEDTFIVYQRRYYRDQEKTSDELWWVPLTWTTERCLDFEETSTQHWMAPVSNITLRIEDSGPYYVLNKQQTGYYRVMYDKENWEAINEVLHSNPHSIHELNRAQIVDDSLEFSAAGILPYNTSMRILSYLSRENASSPWWAAEVALLRLQALMKDSIHYNKLKTMVEKLSRERLDELGFINKKSDDAKIKSNRKIAVRLACAFDSTQCISRGLTHWTALRGVASWEDVLCATLRNVPLLEGRRQWDVFWRIFIGSHNTATRRRLLKVMSCIPHYDTLIKYLRWSLVEEVRIHEVSLLIEAVTSSTPQGTSATLDFILEELRSVKKRLWGDGGMSDIFKMMASHITQDGQLTKMVAVLEKWGSEVSGKEMDDMVKATEIGRHNIMWKIRGRPQLETWLKTNIII